MPSRGLAEETILPKWTPRKALRKCRPRKALRKCRLRKCRLRKCRLRKCRLRKCRLRKCRLRKCQLRHLGFLLQANLLFARLRLAADHQPDPAHDQPQAADLWLLPLADL
ncbi:MAG: pentapeptide repeat-containing protein [Thermoguttaceae bacterium]|nr:pentapeptide repeat-containing protein [Thermoguttaceae bacterium]MBQ2621946.1 pentapeptide repeat-containing protein [Thermoguttaceae bacterium]